MPKVAFCLISIIILFSINFLNNSNGFFGGDLISEEKIFSEDNFKIIQQTEIINFDLNFESNDFFENKMKRYLIFGQGLENEAKTLTNDRAIYSITSENGFYMVGIFSDNEIRKIQNKGYTIIEDIPLEFHSEPISPEPSEFPEISRIQEITGSEKAFQHFNYSGSGVTVAIVDTGVDFSNPDIQHSLARDENNIPIM